jgi:hypothetical protein
LHPLFEIDEFIKKQAEAFALFYELNYKIVLLLSSNKLSLHPLFETSMFTTTSPQVLQTFVNEKISKSLDGIAK